MPDSGGGKAHELPQCTPATRLSMPDPSTSPMQVVQGERSTALKTDHGQASVPSQAHSHNESWRMRSCTGAEVRISERPP